MLIRWSFGILFRRKKLRGFFIFLLPHSCSYRPVAKPQSISIILLCQDSTWPWSQWCQTRVQNQHWNYLYFFPKNIKAYLLFDCKEFLGGEKRQLLHRVFLHHHVCTPLISNLKILATLDTEKQKDDDEIYTHTHFWWMVWMSQIRLHS